MTSSFSSLSLNTHFKIIDIFSYLSGCKVKWSKLEVLPLTLHCPKSLFQRGELSWTSNGIKYLGVTIPPKLADLAKVNLS